MEQRTEQQTVLSEQSDEGVATLTLNRPDRLNAWTAEFAEELRAHLARAAEDVGVRCVVITGAGRGFSAGADLRSLGPEGVPDDGSDPDVPTLLRRRYNPVILGIRELPKPVIASVRGPAAGIGCSLALACDLIVAGESARFNLAFVKIGLVTDGGSSLFVPAAVGRARAFEMAMLGDAVDGRTAAEWGLVNRVVADDALDAEVTALAQRLAAGPTLALAAAKRTLNAAIYGRLADQLDLEAEIQGELIATADYSEGVTAFLEKRDARFEGR